MPGQICLESALEWDRAQYVFLFVIYLDDLAINCALGPLDSGTLILLYADDILLPAPTTLENLLHACENELCWSDMIININKKAQLSLTNPRDACEKFARFT